MPNNNVFTHATKMLLYLRLTGIWTMQIHIFASLVVKFCNIWKNRMACLGLFLGWRLFEIEIVPVCLTGSGFKVRISGV